MMDWFTKWLPDSTDLYWAVVCVALAVLNVWQFARAHGLAMFEKLVKKDGHAPEGKVLVPAASVKVRTDEIERLKAEQQERERLPAIQPAAKRHAWEK